MEGLETALALAQEAAAAPIAADFEPLVAGERHPCIAVDGSHAILADTGSLWAVATRAGASDDALPPRPTLHVSFGEDLRALHAAYEEQGLPVPQPTTAESFADAWRSLEEYLVARRARRRAGDGWLLVDGALEQLPPTPQAIADSLQEQGPVVGVAKRSAIKLGNAPLVQALQAHGPPGTWKVKLNGYASVHVARLHARSRHAFRIDGPEEALPALAAWSNDAAYVGYPYPLAKAHNMVAITHADGRRLAERLRHEMHRVGAGHLADDFHATLDRNAPR